LRSIRNGRRGITFAAALLLIFIILFVAALVYLNSPPSESVSTQKTYFEGVDFTLVPQKSWRVGVPISNEGNLQLSLTSNSSVRVYEEYGQTYLFDMTVQGQRQFTSHVSPAMGIVQVAIVNPFNATVVVTNATCTLTA
jgi:hypothetical protein